MEPTEQPNSGIAEAGDIGNDKPDYESVAREKGWKPKEEFDGDPESWIKAEEFVKRQPLFDKIKTQSKKLKELEKTVEAISKHYSMNVEQEKARAIAELKAERREAIELGEVDRVESIDERLNKVQAITAPVPSNQLPTEIETFIEEQKDWFNKDDDMTSFAVAFNEGYLRKHPGQLDKSLEETLKAVKKAFPEKFQNQRRNSPPPVEGAGSVHKGSDKYSVSRLNHEQKIVYNQLVKTYKQLSHEEYFKSLEDAGYLGEG